MKIFAYKIVFFFFWKIFSQFFFICLHTSQSLNTSFSLTLLHYFSHFHFLSVFIQTTVSEYFFLSFPAPKSSLSLSDSFALLLSFPFSICLHTSYCVIFFVSSYQPLCHHFWKFLWKFFWKCFWKIFKKVLWIFFSKYFWKFLCKFFWKFLWKFLWISFLKILFFFWKFFFEDFFITFFIWKFVFWKKILKFFF